MYNYFDVKAQLERALEQAGNASSYADDSESNASSSSSEASRAYESIQTVLEQLETLEPYDERKVHNLMFLSRTVSRLHEATHNLMQSYFEDNDSVSNDQSYDLSKMAYMFEYLTEYLTGTWWFKSDIAINRDWNGGNQTYNVAKKEQTNG